MAEDYLQSALKTAQEQGDERVQAEAYFALGSLYKNVGYHRNKVQFEKYSTYDGTTYMKSIENSMKAKDLFEKQKSDIGVAKSLLNVGYAYAERNEQDKACTYYRQAHQRYVEAKQAGRITSEPEIFIPGYKTIDEVAMVSICRGCMKPAPATKQACFQNFQK